MLSISKELSHPTGNKLGQSQGLRPLSSKNLDDWSKEREILKKRWIETLGKPSFSAPKGLPRVLDSFELPYCRVRVIHQPTGPGTRQLIVLMEPLDNLYWPRPAALIPFYTPDPMVGYDFKAKKPITEFSEEQFGRHLVQLGYVVACVETFPFNMIPDPQNYKGLDLWRVAADKLLKENPEWTGMGKLVWDARLATNLLMELPGIDKNRLVIMGHSLGGKIAFYAGALDPRFTAILASDFGIGYDFTNWDDPWYLGNKIRQPGWDLAHHQLLALHAPNSFLLIAGEYDKAESWQYINEAKPIYSLYHREEALGMLNHGEGHSPPSNAMVTSYKWLAEQFGLSKDRICQQLICIS